MKNVRILKSQAGFSLVELMVVVAIIGILASLAIPSIGKYMAKARQSEAKTQLSSLYTSEKAFFAEYTAYDSRFGSIGYSPEGSLRYNVGFSAAGFQAGPANGYTAPVGVNASVSTTGYCGANGVFNNSCAMLNGATNLAPPAVPANVAGLGASVTTASTFVGAAAAQVMGGAAPVDQWGINDQKNILNSQSGIL